MNDNEIIKALECCRNNGTSNTYCDDCAYSVYEDCGARQAKDVLDLINRLKAENEGLQKENNILKTNNQSMCMSMPNMAKAERAEARKEFAENSVERVEKAKLKYQRLCKEQGEEMEEHISILFDGIIGIINNLLKEMADK